MNRSAGSGIQPPFRKRVFRSDAELHSSFAQWICRVFQRLPVFQYVGRRHAAELLLRRIDIRILHTERREDPIAQELLERHPGNRPQSCAQARRCRCCYTSICFPDRTPAAAVKRLARPRSKSCARLRAVHRYLQADSSEVRMYASSSREAVIRRDWPSQRHRLIAFLFDGPHAAKLRQIFLDRIGDRESAFFRQHHCRNRDDRFCHRVNLENCVSLKRLPGLDVGISNRVQCCNVIRGVLRELRRRRRSRDPQTTSCAPEFERLAQDRCPVFAPSFTIAGGAETRRSNAAPNNRIGTLRLFYPAAYTLEHMLRVCLCLAPLPALSPGQEPKRPKITGVAHAAFYVSDVEQGPGVLQGPSRIRRTVLAEECRRLAIADVHQDQRPAVY